jgi:hypothetical protein
MIGIEPVRLHRRILAPHVLGQNSSLPAAAYRATRRRSSATWTVFVCGTPAVSASSTAACTWMAGTGFAKLLT